MLNVALVTEETEWSTSRVEWLRFSLYSAALENTILTVMEGVVLVSKAVASEEMDSGETNATRQPSGFEQKCKLTPAKMRGWRNKKRFSPTERQRQTTRQKIFSSVADPLYALSHVTSMAPAT